MQCSHIPRHAAAPCLPIHALSLPCLTLPSLSSSSTICFGRVGERQLIQVSASLRWHGSAEAEICRRKGREGKNKRKAMSVCTAMHKSVYVADQVCPVLPSSHVMQHRCRQGMLVVEGMLKETAKVGRRMLRVVPVQEKRGEQPTRLS